MISIIILNYNTYEQTTQCIRSIYENVSGVEFEIILVDNASIECNPDNFLKLFPEIKLVKNIENRGFARGCNDGIRHAKGDYILLLNTDTLLLNDAITHTFKYLKAHPDVGIATCGVEKNGFSQNVCSSFITIPIVVFELFRIHKLLSKKKAGKILFGNFIASDEIVYPDWVWGTFFMFPRNLLTIFPDNKLSETFWLYVEDMEWCYLARKAGYKIAFIPEGRILHYGGGNAHTEKTRKMMSENFKRFYFLYYGKIYATILLFLLKLLDWSQWRRWFKD